jgi:hypothetical protein
MLAVAHLNLFGVDTNFWKYMKIYFKKSVLVAGVIASCGITVANAASKDPQRDKPAVAQNSALLQDEVQWALNLEKKVRGGYRPNDDELSAYKKIAEKVAGTNKPAGRATREPESQQSPSTAPKANPLSPDEVNWALDFEARAVKGYVPTAEEMARYQDIAQRFASQQPVRP